MINVSIKARTFSEWKGQDNAIIYELPVSSLTSLVRVDASADQLHEGGELEGSTSYSWVRKLVVH